MRETGPRVCFLPEAPDGLRVESHVRREHFERNATMKALVLRQPDDAHASLAQAVEQAIATKVGARPEPRRGDLIFIAQ
jgi:hypothetical protein